MFITVRQQEETFRGGISMTTRR